ncbi:glycine-rich RNA-binding protein 3, mitochondrial-like [Lotus japonicus]|uniref:glycine-rich RNA-binding protein 3, mitochondrial-like n=1 Tax=Lotus japonicus TaxID=34305 RepID=UPI0025893FA1|nr:glycine-rich RNA-binding protein 3, mitochondrial-like [Lotus japonicus]
MASSRVAGFGSAIGDGIEDGDEAADEEDGSLPNQKCSGVSRVCVSLFVDGIAESVSYHQIRGLFAQFGRLVNVFVQRKKKLGRRFRFGFVRFTSWKVVAVAIKSLDGVRLGGASLSVGLF